MLPLSKAVRWRPKPKPDEIRRPLLRNYGFGSERFASRTNLDIGWAVLGFCFVFSILDLLSPGRGSGLFGPS